MNHITKKKPLRLPGYQYNIGQSCFTGLLVIPIATCVLYFGLTAFSTSHATESHHTIYSSHMVHSRYMLASPGTSTLPKLLKHFKQLKMHVCLFFCYETLNLLSSACPDATSLACSFPVIRK